MLFAILKCVAEIDHVRPNRPAHAPVGNEVGGYMRERGKEAARKERMGLPLVSYSAL